jgi:hypothetical protein
MEKVNRVVYRVDVRQRQVQFLQDGKARKTAYKLRFS